MSALRGRIRKLEAKVGAEVALPFADRWSAVFETALARLSVADYDLLRERMALRADKRTEAHEAIWDRWKAAHAAAVRETGWTAYSAPEDWWF